MSTSDQTRIPADHPLSRLQFETLISNTSASLFATAPEQLEAAVERSLESVRLFFQVDRCVLIFVSTDLQVVEARLASYGEGVSRVAPDFNLATVFPWSYETLIVNRRPVRVEKIADLPPEAVAERESWMLLPIRSALTLPIETNGRVSHLIVLNTVHNERKWSDVFVTRLRVFGEILVGALERQALLARTRQAEARLSMAADSADAGLWTLDFDTGDIWATEKARAIFGYSPDEVITLKRFAASVHPEDWRRVQGATARSMRTRTLVNLEYRIILPGGDVRWILSRGQHLLKSTGEATSLTGVCIDVSEQNDAQEALRISEEHLKSGAELAGLAFYQVNFDEGTASVDERFGELCGLPEGQEQGLQPLEFWIEHLHPDDRPRVMDLREQLHDGRVERLSIEYRLRHPIKGEIWIEHLAGVARRDASGRAVRTYGVLRDVTASKRVEEELRDLSQRLIQSHEEERAVLARELHDDVTQRLAVLAIDVGLAERAVQGPLAEAMKSVRNRLVDLSEDVHSMAYQLHPSVLQELGLVEALRTECERRSRLGRLDISMDFDALPDDIGTDAVLCLFRVAQESLNNVVRHAGAQNARITLRQMNGGLLLAVRDDGVGFDLQSRGSGRSLGMVSMRERTRLVNGTLDIESAPGQGTTLIAWVPGTGGSH